MLLLGGYIFAFFYFVKITRWGPQVEYHNLKIKKANQFRFAFVRLVCLPFYSCPHWSVEGRIIS